MKRFILAHDLGTTGNKATLFDDEGRLMRWIFVRSPFRRCVYSYCTTWRRCCAR